MQPNRVSNRSNEPSRIDDLPPMTGRDAASGLPLLPTSKPRRQARRRGPINPVYVLLVTVLPLALLGIMVWAAFGLFPRAGQPALPAQVVVTPGSDLAGKLPVKFSPDVATYTRQGDMIYITGQVTNNTGLVVHDVTLKAFLYRPGPAGGQALAGSGVGWAPGDIAVGATVPFTVTAQISSGPGLGAGTPTPVAQAFNIVQVVVDQVWANPTATP